MSLLRTVGVLPNAWVVVVAKERFLNIGINKTLYDNFIELCLGHQGTKLYINV